MYYSFYFFQRSRDNISQPTFFFPAAVCEFHWNSSSLVSFMRFYPFTMLKTSIFYGRLYLLSTVSHFQSPLLVPRINRKSIPSQVTNTLSPPPYFTHIPVNSLPGRARRATSNFFVPFRKKREYQLSTNRLGDQTSLETSLGIYLLVFYL